MRASVTEAYQQSFSGRSGHWSTGLRQQLAVELIVDQRVDHAATRAIADEVGRGEPLDVVESRRVARVLGGHHDVAGRRAARPRRCRTRAARRHGWLGSVSRSRGSRSGPDQPPVAKTPCRSPSAPASLRWRCGSETASRRSRRCRWSDSVPCPSRRRPPECWSPGYSSIQPDWHTPTIRRNIRGRRERTPAPRLPPWIRGHRSNRPASWTLPSIDTRIESAAAY